jgi:uncharacterized protein YneF (UPF0154 family)
MNTALTIISMAAILPIFTLLGVFVGHKLTIRSQNQPPTNENTESRRRRSIDDALSDGTAR